MKFQSEKEMYEYLCSGKDLYSKELGIYIFEYNDAHALCYYYLRPSEVVSLLKKREETNEYWGAYLGIGGYILDDPEYDDDEHRYNESEDVRALYIKPSLNFCKDTYMVEDWLCTDDVTPEYVMQTEKAA
ncbi:MAG: hypothetical protein IKB01_00640 [Lachnospiraceae bacterium]|nr:hypothetical protein [Lachnospiraceae bacterium]